MMPASSNIMWSSARSEASLWKRRSRFRSKSAACAARRRLRLRFDEAAGTLKLTCPWRTSRRAALAWALDQRDWIDAQLARAEPAEPFVPGRDHPARGPGRSHRLARGLARARRASRRRALLRRARSGRSGPHPAVPQAACPRRHVARHRRIFRGGRREASLGHDRRRGNALGQLLVAKVGSG